MEHVSIKVTANLSPEYLLCKGQDVGLTDKANNYFKYFNKIGLKLDIDKETGSVIDVKLLVDHKMFSKPQDQPENQTFKIGDKVKHRASGQIGIIIHAYETCKTHQHNVECSLLGKNSCVMENTGYYEISISFKEKIEIYGKLLEKF